MTIRVFSKRTSECAQSMQYLDYAGVEFWECTATGLLMLCKASGGRQYIPLQNVESFLVLPPDEGQE